MLIGLALLMRAAVECAGAQGLGVSTCTFEGGLLAQREFAEALGIIGWLPGHGAMVVFIFSSVISVLVSSRAAETKQLVTPEARSCSRAGFGPSCRVAGRQHEAVSMLSVTVLR